MNKIKQTLLIASLVQLLSVTVPVFAMNAQTVTVNNVTDCLVTFDLNNKATFSSVTPVAVYSFYYTSIDPSTRTYASEIPIGQSGQAAVSNYDPSGSDTPFLALGFAPSPGYTTGSYIYSDYNLPKVAPLYAFQAINTFRDSGGSPYPSVPVINLSQDNPCISHQPPHGMINKV